MPSKGAVHGRGEGQEFDLGTPFWQLAGAETLGVVDELSRLAREILERMRIQGANNDGVLNFP